MSPVVHRQGPVQYIDPLPYYMRGVRAGVVWTLSLLLMGNGFAFMFMRTIPIDWRVSVGMGIVLALMFILGLLDKLDNTVNR